MFGSYSTRAARRVTLAAACGAAVAAPLAAQHQLDPVHVVGSNAARANSLHDHAMAMNADARTYRKIAFMHLHSADLRDVSDPQAPTCLALAGSLLYFSGDLPTAQATLEEAAGRAEAIGNAAASANDYIDAGIVARAQGDVGRAEELGERAEKLARSTAVPDVQRDAILSRISRAGEARTAVARDALLMQSAMSGP